MLNVTGTCKVYRVENKGNFVTASLMSSKKNQQGEWENEWFNAKFVGHCKDRAATLVDKSKINIEKSILENRKYQEKSYISIIIFEFKEEDQQHGDSYEPPKQENSDKLFDDEICPACKQPLTRCECLPF